MLGTRLSTVNTSPLQEGLPMDVRGETASANPKLDKRRGTDWKEWVKSEQKWRAWRKTFLRSTVRVRWSQRAGNRIQPRGSFLRYLRVQVGTGDPPLLLQVLQGLLGVFGELVAVLALLLELPHLRLIQRLRKNTHTQNKINIYNGRIIIGCKVLKHYSYSQRNTAQLPAGPAVPSSGRLSLVVLWDGREHNKSEASFK